MTSCGSLLLIFAFAAGICAALLFFFAQRTGGRKFLFYAYAFTAIELVFILISLCIIEYSIIKGNSSVYFSSILSIAFSFAYKISGIFSRLEWCILFTSFLCVLFCLIESFRMRKVCETYRASIGFFLSSVSIALLFILCFFANPFGYPLSLSYDFNGLLLAYQSDLSFIYPFFASLSFITSLVLLAHVSAALSFKDLSDFWLRCSYGYLSATFFSLGVVLFLSFHLSFHDISTKSFWSWSPQQISLFLAFATSIIFVHVSKIFLTKGRMRRFSFFYPFLIVELILLSLFTMGGDVVFKKYMFGHVFFFDAALFLMIFIAVLFLPIYFMNFKSLYVKRSITRVKEKAIRAFNIYSIISILILSALVFFDSFYYLVSLRMFDGFLLVSKIILIAIGVVFIILFINFLILNTKNMDFVKFRRDVFRMIIHVGVILIIAGLICAVSFRDHKIVTAHVGENFKFRDITFDISAITPLYNNNYLYILAEVGIVKNNNVTKTLSPQMRNYDNVALSSKSYNYLCGLGILSIDLIGYESHSHEVKLLVSYYPYGFFIYLGIFMLLNGVACMFLKKRILNGKRV